MKHMKRILYFTSDANSYEHARFKEESNKKGYYFQAIEWQNLSLKLDKKIKFEHFGKAIKFRNNDVAILRGTNRLLSNDVVLFNIVASHLKMLKIKTPNLAAFLDYPNANDKLFQYYFLLLNNYPIITPTLYPNSCRNMIKKMNNAKYPVVLKPRVGSHGGHIYKIDNEKVFRSMENLFFIKEYLIQECIANTFDLRVICTPKKIIGGMKRMAKKGNFVNNYSAGGSVENYSLTEKRIIKDCLNICKLFKCDYLGLDLIIKGDRCYILEVTRFCQFQGFEKATGANIPKEIFESVGL